MIMRNTQDGSRTSELRRRVLYSKCSISWALAVMVQIVTESDEPQECKSSLEAEAAAATGDGTELSGEQGVQPRPPSRVNPPQNRLSV